MLPVFGHELQRYLGIDYRGFGLLFSVGATTGMFTVLIGGALVDRWGPRAMLRLCFAGIGAAVFLLAVAGQRWLLFGLALGVHGLFARPLQIAANAYLVRLFPGSKRRALSLNLAAGSLGGFIFPGLAQGLLGLVAACSAISFAMIAHVPFALVGPLILLSCLAYRGSAASVDEAPPERWHWRDMLLPKRYLFIVFLMALHGAADSTLHVWMALFLGSESFSAQLIGPGFVLSGYAVAYFLARGGLALLPEHFGRRALMVLPGLLGGGILIGGILTRSYLCTAVGYVLGAFCWSVEFPVMMSVLASETPGRFGAAIALQQLTCAAILFGALNGMGSLVAHVGGAGMWQAMLVPAAVFPCIGVGGALWVMRYRQLAPSHCEEDPETGDSKGS